MEITTDYIFVEIKIQEEEEVRAVWEVKASRCEKTAATEPARGYCTSKLLTLV